MQAKYHVEISTQALDDLFSDQALRIIVAANLAQDSFSGQIGHPEFHFDNSCFEQGKAYLQEQRRLVVEALRKQSCPPAWQAFGRLIHACQDFYAHSNYVRIWYMQNADASRKPSPEEIEPMEPGVLNNPGLVSGHIYHPWEWLSFVAGMERIMGLLLPKDSHTNLNLDKPTRGRLFQFAYVAARKRTSYEYNLTCEKIRMDLGREAEILFSGK